MNDNQAILKDYLTNFRKLTSSPHHTEFFSFILENSTFFEKATPTRKIEAIKKYRRIIKPKTKECFRNSQLYSLYCEDFQYFEGFAYRDILPFEHAWLVINGEVIDVTLEMVDRKYKSKEKTSYFGLHIPTEFVCRRIYETQLHDSLLRSYFRSIKC